jgi:hypothetical protein
MNELCAFHRQPGMPGESAVVVEDQQHLVRTGLGGQLVDQRRHQPPRKTLVLAGRSPG